MRVLEADHALPIIMKQLSKILPLLVILALPASAADTGFESGRAAYKAGDYATALREWLPVAEAGMAKAQFRLGGLYLTGKGTDRNVKTGLIWIHKAAEQGFASAQTTLGVAYRDGVWAEKDYTKAAHWLELAAAQRNSRAEYFLATLYEFGRGVERSTDSAYRLYRSSAASGFVRAQYELGVKLSLRGTEMSEAISWLESAAVSGHLAAKLALARILSMRDESRIGCCEFTDIAKGRRLYREVAENGDAYAQEKMGDIYSREPGKLRDYVEATKWYRLSLLEHRRVCLEIAKRLVSNLTQSELCRSRDQIPPKLLRWTIKYRTEGDRRSYRRAYRTLTGVESRLRKLREVMTAAQTKEAQKRVAAWLAQPVKRRARGAAYRPAPGVLSMP